MLTCHLRIKSGAFLTVLWQPLRQSLFVRVFANGPIAQLDRASDFESEGWAFESLWDHQILIRAQQGIVGVLLMLL